MQMHFAVNFQEKVCAAMYYKGVWVTDSYFTGRIDQVESSLRRSIAAIARADRAVHLFYIGIASGTDHWRALARRIDSKKMDAGVSTMHLLYQSGSLANTTELERRLIIRFQNLMEDDRIWNSTGGGAETLQRNRARDRAA